MLPCDGSRSLALHQRDQIHLHLVSLETIIALIGAIPADFPINPDDLALTLGAIVSRLKADLGDGF